LSLSILISPSASQHSPIISAEAFVIAPAISADRPAPFTWALPSQSSIPLEILSFFFSSRRRHTRFSRDWSSDVCSSDLKGRLKKGDTLFIPGAGSGVATFLIQFAKSVGARVIVTSRSEEKCRHAKDIGADLAIATDSDWPEELAGETVDLVIDSVGAATFNRSLDVLKKGGRIVIFGATTEDNVDFNLRKFFYGQYQRFGSTMGSREELRAMLSHMESNQLRPVIDKVFPLEQAQEAFDHLASGSQFGKVVLRIRE